MKGILPCLKGSEKPLSENYKVLKEISRIDPSCIFNNIIRPKEDIIQLKGNLCDIKNERLLYQLREYDSFNFVKTIKNLERKIFILTNDFDKEMFILEELSNLIGIGTIKTEYKTNKIDENVETILVNFKELYEIIIHIYNNLNKDQW